MQKSTVKNVKRYFKVINRTLATVNGKLSYLRMVEGLTVLANYLHNNETDENIWYVGEYGDFTLSDLIAGAYWHFTQWHEGQNSKTYAAMCALGSVFSPGMCSDPEADSPEKFVFDQLASMAESVHGKKEKTWEVVCAIPDGAGRIRYARLEHKGRTSWKTKRIAEKHARDYKANHLRDSWVSEA